MYHLVEFERNVKELEYVGQKICRQIESVSNYFDFLNLGKYIVS